MKATNLIIRCARGINYRNFHKQVFHGLLYLWVIVFPVTGLFADAPPDPGGGPGSGDIPVGGGAPLAGGLAFMLVQGAIYFYFKTKKTGQK